MSKLIGNYLQTYLVQNESFVVPHLFWQLYISYKILNCCKQYLIFKLMRNRLVYSGNIDIEIWQLQNSDLFLQKIIDDQQEWQWLNRYLWLYITIECTLKKRGSPLRSLSTDWKLSKNDFWDLIEYFYLTCLYAFC